MNETPDPLEFPLAIHPVPEQRAVITVGDIRAAIQAGHVGQVTVFCDDCGTERTADFTGATQEIRFRAARTHLVTAEGWLCGGGLDICPACRSGRPDLVITPIR